MILEVFVFQSIRVPTLIKMGHNGLMTVVPKFLKGAT